MQRKLFIGELCKQLLYYIHALQITSIIIGIIKKFIVLIFVGCYPRRKFVTREISASYGIYIYTVDWENFISNKVSKEKFSKGFNFVHLIIIQN